jgi:DNA-directed RNA polymerase specialized sigma24 family protein
VKIKKEKLMRIINEEQARVDEATSQRQFEDDLYNRWIRGDEDAFDELYGEIKPSIVKFLLRKSFKNMTIDDAEDIAQEVFTNLHASPESFGGRAALSTFLKGNAFNKARDSFRRVVKTGDAVTSAGDIFRQSDVAQMKDDPGSMQLPSGSRFSQADKIAIAKDLYDKLAKENPELAERFKTIYMHGPEEASKRLGLSQPSISKSYNKAADRMKALGRMKESLEQDPTWDSDPIGETDREMSTEDEIIYLNDIYSDVYKELYNFRPGSRPPFRTPEAAAEAIDVLFARMEAKERSDAEDARAAAEDKIEQDEFDALMAPGIDLDYELPKQGGMAGTATRPTPDRARRRGTMFPRRPDDRYKLDRLEEMVEAVVKEILNS